MIGLLLLPALLAAPSLSCPLDECALQVMADHGVPPYAEVRSWAELCLAPGPPPGPEWPSAAACRDARATPCLSDAFLRTAMRANWTLTIATRGNLHLNTPGMIILSGSPSQVRASVLRHGITRGARLVVLLRDPRPAPDTTDALAVLKSLWSLAILNAVVFLPRVSEGHPRYDVYTIFPYARGGQFCGRGRALEAVLVGSWDRQAGLRGVLFPEQIPGDMKGCLLPYVARYSSSAFMPTLHAPQGTLIAMLGTVARSLNLRPFAVAPVSRDAIERLPRAGGGRFTGVLGDLQRVGPVAPDLAVGDLAQVSDRTAQFDATTTVSKTETRCWMKIPSPTVFLAVPYVSLHGEIQAGVAISAALTIAVILVQRRLLRREPLRRQTAGPWEFARAMLEQPVLAKPRRASRRILMACFLIETLVLNTAVKSQVSASISIPRESRRIDTLEELVEASEGMEIGVQYNFTFKMMQQSEDAHIRSLMPRIRPCTRNFSECVERLKGSEDGDYALVTFESDMAATQATGAQRFFYAVSEVIYEHFSCWYTRKDYPLKGRMDSAILRTWEGGFQSRWQQSQREAHEDAAVSTSYEDHRVHYHHVEHLFRLFLLGHVLSSAVFCVEFILGKYFRRKWSIMKPIMKANC